MEEENYYNSDFSQKLYIYLSENDDKTILDFIKNELVGDDIVVVSPDVGGVKRARSLAKWLHAPLAIIDKRRAKANVSEVMNIIGDIKKKKARFSI